MIARRLAHLQSLHHAQVESPLVPMGLLRLGYLPPLPT